MKYLWSLLLLLTSSISYGDYIKLEHYDVFKYQVCTGNWLDDALPHKCSTNVNLIEVSSQDNRVLGKFKPWKSATESIYIVTPYLDAENVLEVLQETPLEYTIKTSGDYYSGVFYGTGSPPWVSTYVKCSISQKTCLISNDNLSLKITKDEMQISINSLNYEKNKSYLIPSEALEFAHWSLDKII